MCVRRMSWAPLTARVEIFFEAAKYFCGESFLSMTHYIHCPWICLAGIEAVWSG